MIRLGLENANLSRGGCSFINTEIDQDELRRVMVKNYINFIESVGKQSPHLLNDDCVLDWFGRTIFGRANIMGFINNHVPKLRHKMEKIVTIPPVNHRLLKKLDTLPYVETAAPILEECGQGDCRASTPENKYRPSVEELLKAPRIPRPQRSFNTQDLQFVEVLGNLEFDEEFEDSRKIRRIVLAHIDYQICLIIYEGRTACRKRLSSFFKAAIE